MYGFHFNDIPSNWLLVTCRIVSALLFNLLNCFSIKTTSKRDKSRRAIFVLGCYFIGDTKINPLFLFFLPPDNFTVKAVRSVGTPSPCRSSTTVFRLSHKRRKGLHVTPKPCLDWWHEVHFFCVHAKKCFYGDFSVPFLVVPFFWKWEPCMTACHRGVPSRHPQKANREECPYLPTWKYSAVQIRTYIPYSVCRSTLSDKSLFSSYTDLGDFSQICLHLCLPPFLRLPAASVSHFRSGRKGNSGIGRESKVKPPVFGKNLQPCG